MTLAKVDVRSDALERYRRALAIAARLHAEWEELGRPVLCEGSTKQPKLHPLVAAIASAEREADHYGRMLPYDCRV